MKQIVTSIRRLLFENTLLPLRQLLQLLHLFRNPPNQRSRRTSILHCIRVIPRLFQGIRLRRHFRRPSLASRHQDQAILILRFRPPRTRVIRPGHPARTNQGAGKPGKPRPYPMAGITTIRNPARTNQGGGKPRPYPMVRITTIRNPARTPTHLLMRHFSRNAMAIFLAWASPHL